MRAILDFLDNREIPKSRVLLHILISIFTAGVWILIAILIEVYIASSRENKVWNFNRKRLEAIQTLRNQVSDKEEIIADLSRVRGNIEESIKSNFAVPFELQTVWLWESREQVTSVTSGTTLGKTRTGSVGLGWSDGIGWAASQGVTRGTIAASTTEMISNEFMQLDSGILRIGEEFVAFIGNQFSRTGFYKDILAINTDYDKGVGLSIVNAERIWLTRFPAEFEKKIALMLIKSAFSLTTSKQAIAIDELLNEFDVNVKQLGEEIKAIEADLKILTETEGDGKII